MDSLQICIEANEEQQEILISELSELGSDGFQQMDKYLIAYFNEYGFNSYEVNEKLKNLKFNITSLPEQNWNSVWESNFHPVVINDFCAIRAHFHDPIHTVEHEIIITPKMSFGTGHHATTHMMIQQMKDLDFRNKSVLDFGTGTGILAILAEKLGASDITAIDNDEWSIINARENCVTNHSKIIKIIFSSQIPDENFDIILTNINRNIIFKYLELLRKTINKKGFILMSGLLTNDENEMVETCLKMNLLQVKRSERDNWISLTFKPVYPC